MIVNGKKLTEKIRSKTTSLYMWNYGVSESNYERYLTVSGSRIEDVLDVIYGI